MLRTTLATLSINFLFSSVAISQTHNLEPFEDWLQSRPRWSQDKTEVAYVAVRCGALYGVIGSRFASNDQKPELRQSGNDTIARGAILTMFGNELGKDSGMSNAVAKRRLNLIMDAYQQAVVLNRSLHNNMFHGYIQQDFSFCNEFEQIVKQVAKETSK